MVSQLKFGKVDAEKERNRHAETLEGEGFKGGRMYNSRDRVLQFATEVIPAHWVPLIIGETVQTTKWES